MAAWISALPLLAVAALVAFEDLAPAPSCELSGRDRGRGAAHPDGGLRAMVVADLLLKGSDGGFTDVYFRDLYISKFLKRSIERLKPDILLVLGDISAKGSELTSRKWLMILQQFQGMLGPFMGLPLHIVLGDRDIGECSNLDWQFVSQIASNLPGLDSAGCGAFEISNVTFISLNSVALLCKSNDIRFGVENIIEGERIDLETQMKDSSGTLTKGSEISTDFSNFRWRENGVASHSGPIVLLHFPLGRTVRSLGGVTESLCDDPRMHNSATVDQGPYDLKHTLPPNETEYIFHSLKPRMVFSAHAHSFCDHVHADGTREVTVPAMTWAAKGQPGFVVANFGQNKEVSVSYCSLLRESFVVRGYLVICTLLFATTLAARCSYFADLVG